MAYGKNNYAIPNAEAWPTQDPPPTGLIRGLTDRTEEANKKLEESLNGLRVVADRLFGSVPEKGNSRESAHAPDSCQASALSGRVEYTHVLLEDLNKLVNRLSEI